MISLAKKGKHDCPMCKHKTFVLYIDNDTDKPIHPTVGRCDRENNCGHHYTPKQYYQDNDIRFENKTKYTPLPKFGQVPKAQPSFIDVEVYNKRYGMWGNNNLVMWLYLKLCKENGFTEDNIFNSINHYYVGTSKNGGTIFWQVDLQGKIRTGKVILYDDTGRRRKDVMPPVQWVHSLLELPNYNLQQCMFGEHLLRDTTKKVAIVESEKTAIIASVYIPDMIWLACGGSNGLGVDKCQCLTGRTVILYPDAGMFDKWSEKAKELSTICAASTSSWVEQRATEEERKAGFDIADYLIQTMFVPDKIKQPTPILSNTVESQPSEKEIIEQNNKVLPEDDIKELERFFANAALPEAPIKLNPCTTINDVHLFVESHLSSLRNRSKNILSLPSLHRLQQFKKMIEA
ncbi:MAG: DUF6371 domain-containing protein [Bacteroidales bacterium]|nr:DUF6371 domain-containing protein [Bacteroidales bacterium]